MKIGIIAPNIWVTAFLNTATMLARLGHEVRVYTDDARAPSASRFLRLREDGVEFYVIHNTKRNPWVMPLDKLAKPLLGRRFFTTLVALYRYFQQTADSDVYLVESDWMGFYVGLIRRVRRFRWVVGVHDTDHLRIALNFPSRPQQPWMQRMKLWVLNACDAVRANSYVTRDALVEGGVAGAKIAVIPLHISDWRLSRENLTEFRPQARRSVFERYAYSADTRLLIVMCRLAPVKGLELAVEVLPRVLQQFPSARLLICGPDRSLPGVGSYRRLLEAAAERLGVADKLHFPGNIEIPELRLHLAAADLHLAPSHMDTFSYSVVEATLAGTRSLVSDKVGVAPWMLDAGAGRVVHGRDPARWAEAICAELGRVPGAAEIAAYVHKLEQQLDCEKISRELVTFFTTVMRTGCRPS